MIVSGIEIEIGADAVDTLGVDVAVAGRVVPDDVVHIGRLCDPRKLAEFLRVVPEAVVSMDNPLVALEVRMVDAVKVNRRREHRDARLGGRVAGEESLVIEHPVPVIERTGQFLDGLLAGLLGGYEPGVVDTVVDRLINLADEATNLLFVAVGAEARVTLGKGIERLV